MERKWNEAKAKGGALIVPMLYYLLKDITVGIEMSCLKAMIQLRKLLRFTEQERAKESRKLWRNSQDMRK